MQHRVWTLVCVAVAAALLLSACGGGEEAAKPDRAPGDKQARKAGPGPERDTDGDGIPDIYDDDPNTPEEQISSESGPKHIGDSRTLTGNEGEEIEVTPTKVIDPVPAGEDEPLEAGNRFVGVELTLSNVGDADYEDAPSNGAKLITEDDQQADTTTITEGPCSSSFGSDVKIAPGEQRQGCIPFEVPQGSKVKQLQFGLSSGFADQTGDWDIP